ncbi:hypothetical protein C7H19_03260 [Aphanothece hegewaldii CCALA 016]|uniref:Uncharacterized protein n=1 Tax=Aphanothece hegewaldii CCALA 016 TaxID=2107694 RepID=A0A2T1M2W1_9CHRO|nr:hypothetical protein C7H19_03260 [Aphanothece hegewaldii CCALA 016]
MQSEILFILYFLTFFRFKQSFQNLHSVSFIKERSRRTKAKDDDFLALDIPSSKRKQNPGFKSEKKTVFIKQSCCSELQKRWVEFSLLLIRCTNHFI